jgi:hypothetical protein
MAHEATTEAAGFFEFDIMEPRLEVNETDVEISAQEAMISPSFVELVVIFFSSLINRNDILDHSIGLSRLSLRDEEDGGDKFRVL